MKNILKENSLNELKHKILKKYITTETRNTSILTQDRTNVELIKNIYIYRYVSEQKTTFNPEEMKTGKKVKLVIENVNYVLQHIPTDNITELNELIYAGAKLVSDKIDIPPEEAKQKCKTLMG